MRNRSAKPELLLFFRKRAPVEGRKTPVVSLFLVAVKFKDEFAALKLSDAGVKVNRFLDGVTV